MNNPSMPWDRRLLSLTEDVSSFDAVPAAVVVGIAVTVSVVVVVALCVCGEDDRSSSPELKQIRPRKGPSSISLANDAAPVHIENVKLDDGPELRPPSSDSHRAENGSLANRNSGAPSRSSQISVGSGQVRPPSLRELPELPVGDANRPLSGVENGVAQRISEDDDDYDHLGKDRKSSITPVNYDQIELDSASGDVPRVSPSENYTPGRDNIYAQVRDRNYETVSEIKRRVDPYDQVKEDPYAKLKDDPYAKLKEVPSANSNEDPYVKVKDDDPYSKVKDNEMVNHDHMSSELDPYATLVDENTDVKVIEVRSPRTNSNIATRTHATTNIVNFEDLPNDAFGPDFPEPEDNYAVVNKPRNASTSNEPTPQQEEVDPYVIPPEPPRAYAVSETAAQTPLDGAVGGEATQPGNCELEYTMVTARESLASMTARNALNPYEVVPETENMYATVDGGSGDGVVQQPAPPIPAGEAADDEGNRLSTVSETYAEIEGHYETADAPAPPSLDSLHLMTKQQDDRRHLASPEDSGISGSPSDYAVVDKRSSFSPSGTRLPEIPSSPVVATSRTVVNGNAEGGASNGVALDPNYQSVKDCITYIDENDPNYESVDEAKSREPSKRDRRHVYEEVSPTGANASGSPGADQVRQRVLQGHMYEDIHEIKVRKDRLSRKTSGSEKS